jgi:ribosome-binding factor A
MLLARGVKDPRVGFVTITEVRLPGDLRQATVYVSILGDPEQQQSSLRGLRAAAGYLRREVGRSLKMRYNPELRFVTDSTLEKARRLDALLAAAAAGNVDTPVTELPPGPLPAAHTGREMPLPEVFAPPLSAKLPASRSSAARRGRRTFSKRK